MRRDELVEAVAEKWREMGGPPSEIVSYCEAKDVFAAIEAAGFSVVRGPLEEEERCQFCKATTRQAYEPCFTRVEHRFVTRWTEEENDG